MKKRKKLYIYTSGKVKIKSDIELTMNQVTDICDIIAFSDEISINYGEGYQIARSIFYQIEPPISEIEIYCKPRRKFLVKLIKKD